MQWLRGSAGGPVKCALILILPPLFYRDRENSVGFDLELPVQPLSRHGFQQIRVEKGMMTRVGGSHKIASLLISCCVTNHPKLRGMKQLAQ